MAERGKCVKCATVQKLDKRGRVRAHMRFRILYGQTMCEGSNQPPIQLTLPIPPKTGA